MYPWKDYICAARKESLAKFLLLDLYAKERTISDAMPNRHFIANIADVLPIRNFIWEKVLDLQSSHNSDSEEIPKLLRGGGNSRWAGGGSQMEYVRSWVLLIIGRGYKNLLIVEENKLQTNPLPSNIRWVLSPPRILTPYPLLDFCIRK